MKIEKGDRVMVPVSIRGDMYGWRPGVVEQVLGRKVFVRFQCGQEQLLGCWFPEDLRRRDA